MDVCVFTYHYGRVAYHASYNPNTGMYGRSATAYGPYGRATVAQGIIPVPELTPGVASVSIHMAAEQLRRL